MSLGAALGALLRWLLGIKFNNLFPATLQILLQPTCHVIGSVLMTFAGIATVARAHD
jgi:fluoride ion exporter CrcB/FEX